MSAPIAPFSNPYEHICDGRQRGHSCDACTWQEGYGAAVKNHDADPCVRPIDE